MENLRIFQNYKSRPFNQDGVVNANNEFFILQVNRNRYVLFKNDIVDVESNDKNKFALTAVYKVLDVKKDLAAGTEANEHDTQTVYKLIKDISSSYLRQQTNKTIVTTSLDQTLMLDTLDNKTVIVDDLNTNLSSAETIMIESVQFREALRKYKK